MPEDRVRRNRVAEPGARYRVFGVVVMALGPHTALVESRRSGEVVKLTSRQARHLVSCNVFKTLREHAFTLSQSNQAAPVGRRRDRRFGAVYQATRTLRRLLPRISRGSRSLADDNVESLIRQLEEWVARGFLVSDLELQDSLRVRAASKKPSTVVVPIGVIGIPTRCRPINLRECVASFIANFKSYGRTPDIIIMDDSPTDQDRVVTWTVLDELAGRYDGRIYSMDRSRRALFARAVAQRAGVDPAVLRFALMGHPACQRTEGACRNTLLLLTRGRRCLQTDDDTICDIGQAPEMRPGIRITSQPVSDDYWFFASSNDAYRAAERIDADFLALHEAVLGRELADIIETGSGAAGDLNVDEAQQSFFDRDATRRRRIRLSLPGPIGDTCLNTDLQRLFLTGDSFDRLVRPAASYRLNLTTRHVIRCVSELTISDMPRCIGMNMALDNTELLPPFMPVQARCDGIFGDLLGVCFRAAFAAQLPYGLAHRPPGDRSRTVDEVFTLLGRVRLNDIVAQIIWEFFRWPTSSNGALNLESLGHRCRHLAALGVSDFSFHIRRMHAASVGRTIQKVHHRLARSPGPRHWRADMERLVTVLADTALSGDLEVPADLVEPQTGVRVDRVLADIIDRFGQLLTEWPRIYEAMGRFDPPELESFLTLHSVRRGHSVDRGAPIRSV